MHTLKRQAIVPYTTRQMYELVTNIRDYPRFLPWCYSSHIVSETASEVVATLEIHWSGIRKQFTTRNIMKACDQIKLELVNGPLKHLNGLWQFNELEQKASEIILDLEFEFTGAFIDKLFQPIFQHIANNLVDAFCKRAVELYGTS